MGRYVRLSSPFLVPPPVGIVFVVEPLRAAGEDGLDLDKRLLIAVNLEDLLDDSFNHRLVVRKSEDQFDDSRDGLRIRVRPSRCTLETSIAFNSGP